MVDLTTRYLGLDLRNPFVPSASPLSRDIDTARRLEDAGASALVMYSLFEEEIATGEERTARFLDEQQIGFGEFDSVLPDPVAFTNELDEYLEQLAKLKKALAIPVIASLNGFSLDGWVRHGRELEAAGADALELNTYYLPTDPGESAVQVENRYVELLTELRNAVSLPITMKLSNQFSALPHFVQRLQTHGAEGVALFNRFYQPDIDLETLDVTPQLQLSTSYESRMRIRWIAILHQRVQLSLAITGGIHESADAIKALLAGADVVHVCSALLERGPNHLRTLIAGLTEWMEEKEYESVRQLKGSVSHAHAADPPAYERANYLKVLRSWR